MDKLVNFMKQGVISVPKYIYSNYRKLGIDDSEFILLMYLMNNDTLSFNPKSIALDLAVDNKQVLKLINSLTEKGVMEIGVSKNTLGKMEENLSLDLFYNKLSLLMLEELNAKEENNSSLFGIFESEFGRLLSPMEYEIINSWINENFQDEIIIEALKEATYNGVTNLRYIDKILYEWKKKGYKTVMDVRNSKKRVKEKKESTEIFEFDWLENE